MTASPRRINLALQGGGAHGAFTWGVLDRLLDDDTIEFAAISGTSAGALNGAALKAGLLAGGREAARANLDWLWAEIGEIADLRFGQWFFTFWPGAAGLARAWVGMTAFPVIDLYTRAFSPYDIPQFGGHPLRRIAERFHYEHICAEAGPAFFVAATNVRTGKIRVFPREEITPDAILASACLPTLFRAVEMHDPATGRKEAYWDGGYTGNPALFPLLSPALPRDILIVNINPLVRSEIPRSAEDIQNRINEISFNSALLRELRTISFAKELIADGRIGEDAIKDVYVHLIADDDLMNSLSVATKVVAIPSLLAELKDAGRRAADRFLRADGAKLNLQGSVDLAGLFG